MFFVRQDGTPKLLDFGIAKLLDPDTTDNPETTVAGMRLVTPAYASPEQMAGEPATVRSDIYSLGVILCELVAGCKPVELDARPVAAAAVTGQSVRTALPPLSPDLRAVIERATGRNPRDRYQTVEQMMADLTSYIEGNAVPHYTAARHPSDYDPQPGSLAILPLRLLTKDTGSDAYLATGITDAIITRLSTVGRISVRPTTAVLRYANSDDAAAAGRELNVEYVLTGTIHRATDRVRASVQLLLVRTGAATWAASFFDELADMLRLEESISDQVAQALIPQLSGEEREQLARRGTNSAKAHEAYLRGRWHWNTHTDEGLARALVYFNEAIAEDGRYAQAYAGIADYYVQLGLFGGMPAGESFAAAKQAAATALDIDPTLAEAHTSYGVALWSYDRDYSQAAHHLQLAITLNPDYETAHQWFGMLNSARGRDEIAIASLERARKLVPRSPAVAVSLARAYINAGQPQRVLDDLTNPARKPDEHPAVPEMLAWAYLFVGRPAEAVGAARQSLAMNSENILSMAVLAHTESAAGNISRARALLAEGERFANSRYISGYHLASMHLAVGNYDRAIACLRSAWSARDWWAMWTATDPRWDALRHDPRFQQLIEEHMPAASLRAPTQSGGAYTVRKPRKPARSILPYAALFSALAAGITWYLTERTINRPAAPFANMRIAKVTTDGVATRAAVSPDGRHIAYTKPENGKPVLWLRGPDQSTPTRLTLIEGDLSGLEFTGNGRYISYVAYSKNTPAEGVLYRVPIGGGPPLEVMTEVSGPASLSPDGGRIAFLRSNRTEGEDGLYVAQSDGTAGRRIATRKYPERFAWTSAPAWSADGKRIACSIEGSDAKGFYTYVMVVDVNSGATRIMNKPRWQYVERLSWMADGSGLLAIGQEHESSFQQIWYLPFPGGEPNRISNDLNDYMGVTVTADARSLISVQVQTLSNVYILRPETSARAVQVTPGSGRYFDLAWTPDNHIVYASDATGSADIWSMNADGSNQRRLTSGLGRSYAPSVSPDGRSIVFHSNRSGNWNIWRMDRDGANPMALTSDRQDSNWPRFTPDSHFVVYHHTEPNAMWNLWKVPVLGGVPERLTTRLTTRPVVSPRDGRIACWFSEEANKPDWKVAILPAEGGSPIRLFNVPGTVAPDTALRWTPKGDGITYLDGRKGVSNVWVQPLSGGPARALTDFDQGQIYSFDWASDGRLIYSQGMSTSDVVEIRDESPR